MPDVVSTCVRTMGDRAGAAAFPLPFSYQESDKADKTGSLSTVSPHIMCGIHSSFHWIKAE